MESNFKKNVPLKCKAYLEYIATHPCCVIGCNAVPVQAHHVYGKGMGGGKSSDFDAVPVCQKHHDEVHSSKDSDRREYLRMFFETQIGYYRNQWRDKRFKGLLEQI